MDLTITIDEESMKCGLSIQFAKTRSEIAALSEDELLQLFLKATRKYGVVGIVPNQNINS